ncbi:hypothetical protein PILCRDRAFT_916 [Piloderma croceum F 1598]|uniref:Xylanolytic transcriptional activator regulatory domain-containing protein n=1 Tax=Piloderma croceum (strain F 1598) TaxID=765440 RepID=A0A0C3GJ07_PILCF|nr:hypothetical protein PILCRDRAFT_916 [Piloderma croceum F 1598]
MESGRTTEDMNIDDNSFAASMAGDSVIQSTTPKPKLKRNRIIFVRRKSEDECHYDQQPKRLKISRDTVTHDGYAAVSPEDAAPLASLLTNALGALEPSSRAAFSALLTLLHSSDVVTTSHTPERNEQAVQAAAVALEQLSQQGPSDSVLNASSISQDQNQNLGLSTASFNPPTLVDLQNIFPNFNIVAFLLDHYFQATSIHWLWPIVHRPGFDSVYRAFQSGSHHPTLDFHALVAILCACALQFLPDTNDTTLSLSDYAPGRHVLRQRLLDFSRSVLININVLNPPPTVERIQASALHALYHENEGNLEESYQFSGVAIRMAQTMGMNRDGMALACKLQQLDAEVRRRLWWTLFTLDRFQCMALRRPYIILDQHCDVATPLNLDQFELRDAPHMQGKSLGQPTDTIFHILQSKWARLIGGMWDQCFCTNAPSYQTVIDIERQIRTFELELPGSFRLQSTQGAMARPYLALQNQIMTLQIYHVRILLLRPFLFIPSTTKSPSPEDKELALFHLYAKTVCITFCKRLLAFQQHLQTQAHRAQLRWSSLVSRVFDSALMFALAILMDPNDNQNEELDEWIGLAVNLVKELGPYNNIAPKGVEALTAIRKRTRLASPSSRSGDNSTPTVAQYNERATQVLAQPQPSLSELLGQKSAANPLWTDTKATWFAGGIPSIETLCTPVDPVQALNKFLNKCLARE